MTSLSIDFSSEFSLVTAAGVERRQLTPTPAPGLFYLPPRRASCRLLTPAPTAGPRRGSGGRMWPADRVDPVWNDKLFTLTSRADYKRWHQSCATRHPLWCEDELGDSRLWIVWRWQPVNTSTSACVYILMYSAEHLQYTTTLLCHVLCVDDTLSTSTSSSSSRRGVVALLHPVVTPSCQQI